MTTSTTTSSQTKSYRDLPFHKLIGTTIDELSEDELRKLIKDLNEERASPAVRKAKLSRESKKLKGEKLAPKHSINIDDLLA